MNSNLSEPEKELMRWHYRLGHPSLRRVQFLLQSGVLSCSKNKRHLHSSACKLICLPKCASCQYGKHFMESARAEIDSLEAQGTWDVVSIDDAKSRILPGTWVFRRKQTPDGTIKKYKGRYCVRGDLQEGDFDTYAPVVAWPTVRLFLILSLTLGWHTCSIDYSSAFVQAYLEQPVWIHLPRGFAVRSITKMCLRLKKVSMASRLLLVSGTKS